ncbi:MAG: bifunctional 3-(3-hydroxy-phenyl)propionate/3-hydroxycinnamic acid hydroxylase [Rubrivivax sp.]|nr:MAG: bifunctional 3-(3-hydroxy-phenyl)propionate/3-hydroxycinnamic acid hydroxylase [Rubrivivax sp.]
MQILPEDVDVDVAVIGLGPVGALVANLLGRHGIKVLVVEKSTEMFMAPRAIALDNEALRILQMCGIEEGEFQTISIPTVRMHSPWFGQFSGANTAGQVDGHPKLVTFFQPELESLLRRRLSLYPSVQCALGVELNDLAEVEGGVEMSLTTVANDNSFRVKARYVVGADGANSKVRQLLGKDFSGQTFAEDWLVVDAKNVPDPIDHVEFICDHRRPTPHMVAPGGRQRWEFKLRPGETKKDFESPESIKRLLSPWIKDADIEIERVAVYRFHARLVDAFSKGRVFLAGDAAHITPPFVGQGLVAGMRDAANLCWKLAWVIQGRGDESLLASYNAERRPHAKAMIGMAKLMGRLVMPSNQWLAFATHGLMVSLNKIAPLRRHFEELEVKPKNIFRRGLMVVGACSAHVKRGALFPQGWIRQGLQERAVLSDQAIGDHLVMIGLGVDPMADLDPTHISQWHDAGGKFIQIDPRGCQVNGSLTERWEDLTGTLVPLAAPPGWVVVVRPDRTVMHDGSAKDVKRLIAQTLAVLSPNRALASMAR